MTIAITGTPVIGANYTSTGPQTISHAGGGSIRGAVVMIGQATLGIDEVSGVTYGGAAMTRVYYGGTSGTWASAVYLYWLDGVAAGTQNVVMTTTGSSPKSIYVAGMSVASGKKVSMPAYGSMIAASAGAGTITYNITGIPAGVSLQAFEIGTPQAYMIMSSGWTTKVSGTNADYSTQNVASSATTLVCSGDNYDKCALAAITFVEGTLSTPVTYTDTAATSLSTMVDPIVNPNFGRINFPAPVATLSAAMPDAVITVQKSNTYVASATTLSAVMTVAKAAVRVNTTAVTDVNVLWSGNPTLVSHNPTSFTDYFSPGNKPIIFKLASIGLPAGALVTNAELSVVFGAVTDSITVGLESIDAAYNVNTVTYATRPAHGALTGPSKTITTPQSIKLDALGIVNAIKSGTAYAIGLVALSGTNSQVDTQSPWQAVLTITYWTDASAIVSGQPMTVSATMMDSTQTAGKSVNIVTTPATESHLMVSPAISTTASVNYGATAATSTAIMVDPAIYAVHPFDFAAVAFTATADMLNGVFALPVTISASVATESHLMTDAAVLAEDNAKILAAPFTGSVLLIAPIEAQNATADPYYNRLLATTDSDDYWYRLNEMTGTTLVDARADTLKMADLIGTYNFGVFGPEARKAIHFDNGYAVPRDSVRVALPGADPRTGDFGRNSIDSFVFEITLRTTDANGVLFYGQDNTYQNPLYYNAISVKNGLVNIEYVTIAGWGTNMTGLFDFSGFKRVDDGQWHHIVVAYGNSSLSYREQGIENLGMDTGIRIFIDGQLDRRRRSNKVPEGWALPDSFFGMDEAKRIRPYATSYIQGAYDIFQGFAQIPVYSYLTFQKNFTGDVMEATFRRGNNLSTDSIQALYYDVFGIIPVYATPAIATGVMPDGKGKGNQKRVLVLWHNLDWAGLNQDPVGGSENISDLNGPPEDFDHAITVGFWQTLEPKDFNDMHVITALYAANAAGQGMDWAYRDPITDLPRLINLQTDVDMTDVDLIVFRNWPDEQREMGWFSNNGYGPKQIDDFLASVKQAVVDGCGLEVTSPSLALRLGLISGATPVPTLYEYNKDARSAAIDPWSQDSTTPPVLPSFAPAPTGGSESFAASASSDEPYVEIIPVIPDEDVPPDMFGRHINHDPRSRNYAFTADPLQYLKSKTHTRVIPIMNQQGFGACTGFAAVGALGTAPLYATVSGETLDAALAMKIYSEATKIDPFPGEYPPDFTGSDGLSVAKVMKTMGLISGYQHAFTLDDALAALQSGPVITGIPWYQGFNYPNPNTGLVSISGTRLGGHEVCVVGINVTARTVTAANSWGPNWGKDGFFTFSWADWATLLGEGGDVTILLPRDIWAGNNNTAAENYYLDTHANNFQRVVAEIPDLTNIPSAFMSDAVLTWNQTLGMDYETLNTWSYKLTERDGGLEIGDEMMDPCQFWNKQVVFANNLSNTSSGVQWNRFRWAINPDGLPSGTPVYKFSNTIWNGNTQVSNPYAEYIGGAVVQPGDSWGGVRIAGKIWIHFAEWPGDPYYRGTLNRQLIPPNAELLRLGFAPETEAMRTWDYSVHRVMSVARTVGSAEKSLVLSSGGPFSDGAPRYVYRKLGTRVAPSEFERFPVDTVIAITWTQRGLAWLAAKDEVVSGDVTIRPLAMASTGALVNPVTVAEHGVIVTATASQAVGVMVGFQGSDNVIRVFAAEASGHMTQYGKTITADPFLASGEIVDNFNMVKATGEEVVLYLYNDNQIDLYLKEDK